MIRIAVLGNKGGSGKTLLSHIICCGLGAQGVEAYHFTTDQGRSILSAGDRHYAILDGRDLEKLERILEMLTLREGIAVIDGCANGLDADSQLARLSDITLIPFQASAEDMRVAKTDLERLPTALGVPMRWPSNLWQRTFTDRLLARYLGAEMPRIAEPIYARSALATLLGEEAPDSRITGTCREIAVAILRRGGFKLEEPEHL